MMNHHFDQVIHISQVPATYDGIGTYINDMNYQYIPNNFDYEDCMDWLNRKIAQLDAKIEKGSTKAYLYKWKNQRDMYAAIVKYLSLPKLSLRQCR